MADEADLLKIYYSEGFLWEGYRMAYKGGGKVVGCER
jgi:hypothetical protein